jgi:hypothetical protein
MTNRVWFSIVRFQKWDNEHSYGQFDRGGICSRGVIDLLSKKRLEVRPPLRAPMGMSMSPQITIDLQTTASQLFSKVGIFHERDACLIVLLTKTSTSTLLRHDPFLSRQTSAGSP